MRAKKSETTPKKTTKKSAKAPAAGTSSPLVEGPRYVEGTMHFSPNDLVRYDLYRTRVEHALQQITINRSEAEAVKRRAEEDIRRIQSHSHQLMNEAKVREEEFKAFQSAIGETYSLDMKQVSYDDRSGKLYLNAQEIPASSGTE
jgi:hypothetical protein